MKLLGTHILAALVAAQGAAAHYIFTSFGAGSTPAAAWKYVRRNSNPAWLQNGPVTDLSSKDLRCNLGGGASNGTETLTMKAGDTFTWGLDTAVYHTGPVSIYMSKAPALAKDYDGSGEWFKTEDWGAGGNWNMKASYSSKIPKCIPSGEYLVRIQQIGIHNPGAAPQFYISCAQVKVTDGGTANPAPTVKIPGAFKGSDPGLNANVYNGNLRGYVVPGPAVFTC